MTSSTKPAIIRIRTSGKNFSRVNYSRRMYAIIRRYTPNVIEGEINECFADLTGLRTFFKMTYAEMAEKIIKDLNTEIGVSFTVKIATIDSFEKVKNKIGHSIEIRANGFKKYYTNEIDEWHVIVGNKVIYDYKFRVSNQPIAHGFIYVSLSILWFFYILILISFKLKKI